MKNLLFFLFLAIILNYSCDKDKNRIIETDVEIQLILGTGDNATCGEFCGTRIYLPDLTRYKLKSELPDSIINKPEYWNKTYIATIEYLEEECTCKNGLVDPGNGDYPTYTYPIVDILDIREK